MTALPRPSVRARPGVRAARACAPAPFVAGVAAGLAAAAISGAAHAQGSETGEGPTPGVGANADAPSLRPYAPGTPQLGIGGTPTRPATAVLRQDEDWAWLADVPEAERRALDGLKRLPLNANGSTYLTFAFDGRLGVERFDDQSFGDFPGEDSSVHVRANPHVALSFGDRARLYGALKYGDVGDRRFPASPAEDDGPDVHHLFAEVAFGDLLGGVPHDAFARLGRQELHYGAGRLVSIRNGPNVRFDFDGATVRARLGPTISEALYVRPAENDPGDFDNGSDTSQALWGLYTTTALGDVLPSTGAFLGRSNLDLYYLGFERETSPYAFQDAPVDETRHTVGARFWTGGAPTDGWNLDIEAAWQFGDADGIDGPDGPIDADIGAGFLAGVVSYGFADAPWTPVIASRFGASSGDDDPGDDTLATFRAPFPPGRYFGESNPIGPGNVGGVGPYLSVHPVPGLVLTARYEAFWRLETEDGLYSPPQVPLRGTTGDERFVGQEFSLIAGYAIGDHASVNATVSRFEADDYLGDVPPGEDIGYAHLRVDFQL